MESIKINGVITAIHPTEQKSEKFTVQRFWVKETEGQYPNTYEVQCTGKTIGVLNDYKVGENVSVAANLNGREYTSKSNQTGIFMTLGLWKIEKVGAQQAPQPQAQYQQPTNNNGYSQGSLPEVPF